jgi:hypothetical protein
VEFIDLAIFQTPAPMGQTLFPSGISMPVKNRIRKSKGEYYKSGAIPLGCTPFGLAEGSISVV